MDREVETRGFKGPRAYDEAGLPLHFDNESVFKERIYRDKADPNIMHDVITTIDHALTRPWTVAKGYVRNPDPRPDCPEYYIADGNGQILIGKENHFFERRWAFDAGQKRSGATRFELFQTEAELTSLFTASMVCLEPRRPPGCGRAAATDTLTAGAL